MTYVDETIETPALYIYEGYIHGRSLLTASATTLQQH
jgi:hypothetical protein